MLWEGLLFSSKDKLQIFIIILQQIKVILNLCETLKMRQKFAVKDIMDQQFHLKVSCFQSFLLSV